MTNQEYIEKIEREREQTKLFRSTINQREIVKFLSEINFDEISNIHKHILLFLLRKPNNIYQINKHLIQTNITSSYGYTHKCVKYLERKGYVYLTKKGRGTNVSLTGEGVFDAFSERAKA